MDNIDFSQLGSILAPILNDPEAMAGLSAAAAQLGFGDLPLGGFAQSGADNEQSGSASSQTPHSSEPSHHQQPDIGSFDIGDMLGKVMPLLGSTGGQDDNTRLLSALRPFLHGSRAKRLDDAERMVKLLGVIATLHRQGIL